MAKRVTRLAGPTHASSQMGCTVYKIDPGRGRRLRASGRLPEDPSNLGAGPLHHYLKSRPALGVPCIFLGVVKMVLRIHQVERPLAKSIYLR